MKTSTRCHIHDDGGLLVVTYGATHYAHKLDVKELRKLRGQLSDTIDAIEIRAKQPQPTDRSTKP